MSFRRIIALVLALALAAGCAALAFAEEEEEEDPVLLTVNGEELRLSDAQYIYDYYVDLYSYYGYDMENETNLSVIRAMSTEQLVWSALIHQYAAANGLDDLTEEEEAGIVESNNQVWEEAISEYILYSTGLSDTSSLTEEEAETLRQNAIAYYQNNGFTVENTLASERETFISERVKAAVLAEEDVEVTEEDIAAHHASLAEQDRAILYSDESGYDMAPAEIYAMYTYFGYELYYIPEGFRMVKYILLEPDDEALQAYLTIAALWEEQAEAIEAGETPEDAVTYDQVEAARLAVIDSVRAELDAVDAALDSGISFDELIAQYDMDSDTQEESARSEGYMVSENSWEFDSDFITGAFSVDQPGEISDPVVTSDGVYLILYASEVPAGPVEMTQEMHDAYYEELISDKENTAFTAIVEQWIADAEIIYTEAGQSWDMSVLYSAESEESGED